MRAKPARKKHGAEPKRAPKTPVPGWIWLLTGGLLGAFVMFLLHVSKIPTAPKQEAREKAAKTQDASSPTASTSDETIKPRYDFYRLLKENQPPITTRNETPANTTTTTEQASNSTYLLQVASYKNDADADATRAKLLLLGLTARVEKVTLRNTETWHRVLIGPVKSLAETDRIHRQLTDNKYDALVLKAAL
ncbi:MAG: hypothetical protein RL497_565 [Pseudomonadota bacterium]